MILLFTDFGWQGPYVGQLHLALAREAPGVPVVDLMHDAPTFSPLAAGHLLAALTTQMPPEAVVVAVVDPGVGSARRAILLDADGRRFVGPDNGLLAVVAQRASSVSAKVIQWRPPYLSATFHGRDLFAPVAARLYIDKEVASEPLAVRELGDYPPHEPLAEVIYIDGYGNAWTGIALDSLPGGSTLRVGPQEVPKARTFSDVEKGQAFWYENSAGLVEIAVRQGSAADHLGLRLGTRVTIES